MLMLIMCIIFGYCADHSHRNKIDTKIQSMNGVVLEVEQKILGGGGFVAGKGIMIYKITYKIDGKTKIGWVKFSLSTKWKLDN